MNTSRPIIVILGPTAGGKTWLSLQLATKLSGGGECICADSMQIYRGMDIGTAKPTAGEQTHATHHLLDVADPSDDSFTVDHWRRLAETAISNIRSRGGWPIVVGGTNLYIKSLLEGLFDGPDPDPAVRTRLEGLSSERLRADLERVDPKAASRIHPNDRRRTVRALEVYDLTGTPISEHQRQWDRGRVRDDCVIVGLDYPTEIINRRINARVRNMMEAGFLDEVRTLNQRGGLGRLAREAVGYGEILSHLAGDLPLEDTVEMIKVRSRRFAKQQRTWLKRFRTYPRLLWLSIDEAGPTQSHVRRILEWLAAQPASGANTVMDLT